MNRTIEQLKADFQEAYKGTDVQRVIKNFLAYEDALFKQNEYEAVTLMNVDLIEYLFIHNILEKVIYFTVRYLRMVEMYGIKKSTVYYAIYGTLEYTMGNYDQAKEYLLREIDEYRKEGNETSVANCMSNMGNLFNIEGNYLEAVNILLDAKMSLISLDLNKTEYYIKVILNISRSYLELSDFIKAKKYLDEVLTWGGVDENPAIKVELYTNLGRYYEKLGNYEQTNMFFEEAIELAEEGQMIFELRNLYKLIGDHYATHGDYQRSNKYYKKFSALAWKMSNNNQIAIRQLAEAEITLKMKENVVKGQKEQHLQKIVLEDEHDLLTNTFSGSYLGQYIEKMIAHTETKAAFSLMFISVELVTEGSNYNFRAQETILIEAAALMVRFCTDLQVVARLEANKFAICFPGDQLELSKEHGDAILKGLQEKVFMYEGQRLEVHFNGGLVEYEASHAKDLQGLFRMADLALYQAEKSPRNSLVVW